MQHINHYFDICPAFTDIGPQKAVIFREHLSNSLKSTQEWCLLKIPRGNNAEPHTNVHSKVNPTKFRQEHRTNCNSCEVQTSTEKSNDVAFAARQQPKALRLSAVRYDSVWKLPGEVKLFISMERCVGGQLTVLPAHSAVVWATNCTSRKTLCNHHAIVYSGRVTTATGFRDWAEEPALVWGRKSVADNPVWPCVRVFVFRYEFCQDVQMEFFISQTLIKWNNNDTATDTSFYLAKVCLSYSAMYSHSPYQKWSFHGENKRNVTETS